jgi:hypothetical protein
MALECFDQTSNLDNIPKVTEGQMRAARRTVRAAMFALDCPVEDVVTVLDMLGIGVGSEEDE